MSGISATAAAFDAALDNLLTAVEDFQSACNAADRAYRAAQAPSRMAHGPHPHPKYDDPFRYLRSAISGRPLLARMLHLTPVRMFRVADIVGEDD